MEILVILSSFLAIYFALKHEPHVDYLMIRSEKQWQVIQLLLSRLADVSTVEYFEDTLTVVEFLLDADIEKLEEEK